MDKADALNIAQTYASAVKGNLIDMQLELMRLRRKIDCRIEPHPFRESEFESSNPLESEIIKYGQEININVAYTNAKCHAGSPCCPNQPCMKHYPS
jgi:hypothetical protein